MAISDAAQWNWRRIGATDKFLRHLEALLLVSDKETDFSAQRSGDVIEPEAESPPSVAEGPMPRRPRRRWRRTRNFPLTRLPKRP